MSARDDAETVRWLTIFMKSLAEATDNDIEAIAMVVPPRDVGGEDRTARLDGVLEAAEALADRLEQEADVKAGLREIETAGAAH